MEPEENLSSLIAKVRKIVKELKTYEEHAYSESVEILQKGLTLDLAIQININDKEFRAFNETYKVIKAGINFRNPRIIIETKERIFSILLSSSRLIDYVLIAENIELINEILEKTIEELEKIEEKYREAFQKGKEFEEFVKLMRR